MGGSYKFEPEAERDLNEAFDYYESQDPGIGLGDRFIKNVTDKAEKIADKPNRYFEDSNGVRKAKVPIFPFYIFYIIKEAFISIIAVWHNSRNPEGWKKRIREDE